MGSGSGGKRHRGKRAAGAKPMSTRPEWEHWLWLATDGEVRVAQKIPEGGMDVWLGYVAHPPLTKEDAETIRTALCDLAPASRITEGPKEDRWFFRADPRTQGDLRTMFRQAVEAEAAGRPFTHG